MIVALCLSLISVYLWRQLDELLDNIEKCPKKIRNYLATIHAVSIIILNWNHTGLIRAISMGYFMEDALHRLQYSSWLQISNIVLILHHLFAVVFYMSMDYIDAPALVLAQSALFWAEISNIPGNLVYHYLKASGTKGPWYPILQISQTVIYSSIRIGGLGYYYYHAYETYSSEYPVLLTLFTLIYLMGLYWSATLFGQSRQAWIQLSV